jgi:hypothetical protein
VRNLYRHASLAQGLRSIEREKHFCQRRGKKNVAKHMQLSRNSPFYAKTLNVFLYPIPSKNLILSSTPLPRQLSAKPTGLKIC